MKRWVAISLIVGMMGGVALAQSSTGTITGQVTDPQKSLIPGAQITLTNIGTNESQVVESNAGGEYSFPSLNPGSYNVSASAKGFQNEITRSIEVSTGVTTTVNFKLRIGADTTVVEVTASGEMLNQDSATLNTVVDKDMVVQLPYPERSALSVATLSPGVNGDPQYAGGVQSENPGITTQPNTPGASIAIAGGRPGSASQLVDGFDVTLSGYPRAGITFSKDIVHDVTVQQGFLPAQYGRNGGGIINQSTASGTNLYHGKLIYRNEEPFLEARTQGNASPPGAHQNMFTAMLSGPLPIPSRRHSKVFFLVGYEPIRVSNQSISRRRIASPNELAGYFHDSPDDVGAGIWNEFTTMNAQGFPSGAQQSSSSKYVRYKNANYDHSVCNSALAGANCGLDDISNLVSANPTAQFLNALQPTPLQPSKYVQYLFPTGYTTDDIGNTYANAGNLYDTAGNNVQSLRGVKNADDRYSIRIDAELSKQDSIFARYTTVPVNGNRFDYFGPNSIADQIPTDSITSRNIGIGETHIFSGAKVNEIRVTYLRSNRYRGPASQALTQDFGALMGLTPAVAGKGFPTFNYGNNLSAIGSGGSETDGGRSLEINFGIGDDFSVLYGRHTLKFGVDYRALQLNRTDDSDSFGGNYGFNQSNTAGPSGGGSTLATFDLGVIGSYVNRGVHPFYYRWKYGAFYMQDDWRVLPKLTLNIGVRYNIETPRMEKNGMQGSFVPSVQGMVNGSNVQGAFAFSGHNGLRNTLWPTNYKGVEPRIGFAYAPTPKLSVRSSYSLMHTPLTGVSNSVFPDLPMPPPFFTTVGTSQGGVDKSQWVNYITNPVAVSAAPAIATPSMGPLTQYASSAGSAGTGSVTAGAMPYISQSYAVPYVQIWTASVQYQFAKRTMVEASFVGQHGVHLYAPPVDKNVGPLTGPSSFVAGIQNHLNFNSTATSNPYGLGTKGLETLTQSLRPYQQFYNNTIWEIFDRKAVSSYNALYLRFIQRQSRSLTFMGAFSWSKSLDNASSGSVDGTVTDSYGFAYPQLPYSLAGEYSLSGYDQPLTFKSSYIFSLPFGKGRAVATNKAWVDELIGNWSTTGIFRASSGVPMHVQLGTPGYFVSTTPGSAIGNEGTAIQDANIRPNRVPGQPLIRPNWKQDPFGYNGGGYLNPLAFSIPGSQDNPQLGSVPRTMGGARNPRTITFDATLRKAIQLRGRGRQLEFQADAINAVNHANYFLNTSLKAANLYTGFTTDPSTGRVYGTPNAPFGKMGGASAGRVIALGATFTF